MRVITGTAKGIKLDTLPGDDVRPTGDLVKGAIFNAIQFDIEGRRVLDIFCGSGQLGIEALSRGAKSAVFVDSSRRSIGMTEQNLKKVKFSDRAKTVVRDYADFLKNTTETFDIILMDPPYSKGFIQKALPLAAEVVSKYGVIICEHESTDLPADSYGGFSLAKTYRHGRISVSIYRAVNE